MLRNPAGAVNAAQTILLQRGHHAARDVLLAADVEFEKTGHDNWDGGTDIYTIWLRVDPVEYAKRDSQHDTLQSDIEAALKPIIEQESRAWFSVRIAPNASRLAGAPMTPQPIDRDVRDNITLALTEAKHGYNGDLKHVEFLTRLYDLTQMRSTDNRYKTAVGDIGTHCDSFSDWDLNWVFDDERFSLGTVSDEDYLKFLCEMLHPKVRRDRAEAVAVASVINKELQHAGWKLVEVTQGGSRGRYAAEPAARSRLSTQPARAAANFLDAHFMQEQLSRAESAVQNDPALAIGTAKELVETCCKTMLGKLGLTVPDGIELPKMANMLLEELELLPRTVDAAEQGAGVLRALLGNFANIPHRLAELRNLYGTGHGKDGRFKGLEPHHAQLAVESAQAFINFVVAAFRRREQEQALSGAA
jgi:hypothetical protein